ncbi:MAG TPA: hypothetical protein VN039_12660 [Nitrospira sp.]|nr:hypothetical protein [Nitrospira sp.]
MSTHTDSRSMIDNRRLLSGLKRKLADLKRLSILKSQTESQYKEFSAPALSELVEADGFNGRGVRFELDGVEYAAIACQPTPGKLWNAEPLIEWLKKNGHWSNVSTEVLDPHKLQAEIAAGNIPQRSVAKFQIDEEPKKPYVKFINPKPDSQ